MRSSFLHPAAACQWRGHAAALCCADVASLHDDVGQNGSRTFCHTCLFGRLARGGCVWIMKVVAHIFSNDYKA